MRELDRETRKGVKIVFLSLSKYYLFLEIYA